MSKSIKNIYTTKLRVKEVHFSISVHLPRDKTDINFITSD